MPYETVPKHLNGLTLAQANKWGEVYDAVLKAGGDKEKAARVAWGVVKGKMEKGIPLKGRPGLHEEMKKSVGAEGLSLAPSKSNPAIMRWQAMDRHIGEHGHKFLSAVSANSGMLPVTADHAKMPHIQRLVKEGYLKLHDNPKHYWYEHTAQITKKGQGYHDAYKAAHEDSGHQESLFKGVICIYFIDAKNLAKAIIPALNMVPEDMEEDATPDTWDEDGYSVTWKRGRKGIGSVTFEGNGLFMPFVMTAAGKRHAHQVAASAAPLLRKGQIPRLDGVFRVCRKKV